MIRYILFLLFISSSAFAQEKPTPSKDVDSTTVGKTKSPSALKVLFSGKPGKALTYSLLLPGAGQVYNKRIWKVPFVYAALGGSIYGIYFNKKEFNRFDNAYNSRLDYGENSNDEFKNILSTNGIYQYRNYYDYYYQLMTVVTVGVYLLNGIEAFVDRHLQEFNITDDISLNTHPVIFHEYAGLGVGLGVTLNFK